MFRTFITAVLAALAFNAFAAVDANQATRAELESVKGVGPSLSGKIIAARQSASFKDWNDMLERVSGVGPGNAARFSQAGLTVGGNAYQMVGDAKPAKSGKTQKSAKPAKAAKADAMAKPDSSKP